MVRVALFFALVATTCGLARADVIFSDLGGSYPTGGSLNLGVSGGGPGTGDNVWSMGFTAGATYDVTQIDVALTDFSVSGGKAIVSLWTDSSGTTPGMRLVGAEWNVAVPSSGLTTINGITGITLDSGASYFLQIAPGSTTVSVSWYYNNQSINGPVYVDDVAARYGESLGNTTLGAFDVLGTPVTTSVPVFSALNPDALALLGFGLLCVAEIRRRKSA